MNRFLIVLFAVALFVPLTQAGKLILAGGNINDNNGEIYRTFISLSSPGNKDPYIGVITTGAETYNIAKRGGESIVNRLKNQYDVEKVEWLPFHSSRSGSCNDRTLAGKLKSMTGIWINGGNIDRLTSCFIPNGKASVALTVMRQQFNSNFLAVLGSSAGAAVLTSLPRSTGTQTSWETLVNGPAYQPDAGLGLFKNGFVDTHFSEQGRYGNLLRLVYDLRAYSKIGFGIDENTAMLVQGSKFEVLGSGGVYIFDVSNAKGLEKS